MRIAAPDASLTAVSGMAAVRELCDRLGMIEALDAVVGSMKCDDRSNGHHRCGGLRPQETRVAYNYQGQRCGRPHVARCAELKVALVADLLAGDQVPRPGAPGLLRRALRGLPAGVGEVTLRADGGYVAVERAVAAHREGAGFAIGATRIAPVWKALAGISETDRDRSSPACAPYPQRPDPAPTSPTHPGTCPPDRATTLPTPPKQPPEDHEPKPKVTSSCYSRNRVRMVR